MYLYVYPTATAVNDNCHSTLTSTLVYPASTSSLITSTAPTPTFTGKWFTHIHQFVSVL